MAEERDLMAKEVDEELRREQLKKIWDNYGTYIIAAAALIVVGVGGFKWWEGRRIAATEAAGARFEEALSKAAATDGKSEEASKTFGEIAKSGSAGYSTLAQLMLAANAAKAGKTEEAIAAYETSARSTGDGLVKDFARLQVAALKVDSADWTEMQNRLNDLIADRNPWRYSARELLGLSALRAGKTDEARQTLAPLTTDPMVPASIRERASAMLGAIVAAELAKTATSPVALEPTEDATPEAQKPEAAPKSEPARAEPAAKGKAAVKAGGAKK